MKFQIDIRPARPRFNLPGAYTVIRRTELCINCGKCASLCLYQVHGRDPHDPRLMAEPESYKCMSCFTCVQGCSRAALLMVNNEQFRRLGHGPFSADIIRSQMLQAEAGRIPVSGAGYRGPFAGPDLEGMWFDMSEIVRPTRDGIHGREYISTSVDLGRKPATINALTLDEYGEPVVNIPTTLEIQVPMLLGLPEFFPWGGAVALTLASAAQRLHTLAILDRSWLDAPALADYRAHLVPYYRGKGLREVAADLAQWRWRMLELDDSAEIEAELPALMKRFSSQLFSLRVPAGAPAASRVLELAKVGAQVIHLYAPWDDGGERDRILVGALREAHRLLVEADLRDQVTLLASGGVAESAHVPKLVVLGADAVVVDTPLLLALECDLCLECTRGQDCPRRLNRFDPDWGAQRVVNLVSAWHDQLLEVLGAMGLRETSRLRGEQGRAMDREVLDRELALGLEAAGLEAAGSGRSSPPASEAVAAPQSPAAPGAEAAAATLTRLRWPLARYEVVRSSACIACGTCMTICPAGVFSRVAGYSSMTEPNHALCLGPDCAAGAESCLAGCPRNALSVKVHPHYDSLGDYRWTADLIRQTWSMAETGGGLPDPVAMGCGDSGGGFDSLYFELPAPIRPRVTEKAKVSGAPAFPQVFPGQKLDLSLRLNRRGDGPALVLPFPIYGGGMSFGSIGLPTMLSRARAATALGTLTCTGEGGYPPELIPYADHIITQIATGLFGVSEETIQRAPVVEFKYAQGAKPGLGGHLLGDKVTPQVASMRQSVEGISLFSPFPFHSVYSVEDHKKHVDWVRQINPRALISVKVSTPVDVDMVAVGSYYAGAHIVHLDGGYGGTGAAPDIAKKNIAMPIEYAVLRTHRFLQAEGIRDQVTLMASGGIRTALDVAKIICLGADGAVLGTAELVALECVRCGNCESGRGCPRGIATTDALLTPQLSPQWGARRLVNFYQALCRDLEQILQRLGMKSIAELRGRVDLLHFQGTRLAKSGRS